MSIKRELFKFYKITRTTDLLDDDVKYIKKINNILLKFSNTQKDKYKEEALNIVKSMENFVHFNMAFCVFVKQNLIDENIIPIFEEVIEKNYVG